MASRSGVYVKDVHTGEIVELFDWKETSSVHLAHTGHEKDVKRICVVHTTKDFRCGIGELHIYCLEAPRLLVDLVRQGKGTRQKSSHTTQRPLSLSEGDLRIVVEEEQIENVKIERQPQTIQTVKRKFTINALSLFSSTRSGSEAKLINVVEKDRK